MLPPSMLEDTSSSVWRVLASLVVILEVAGNVASSEEASGVGYTGLRIRHPSGRIGGRPFDHGRSSALLNPLSRTMDWDDVGSLKHKASGRPDFLMFTKKHHRIKKQRDLTENSQSWFKAEGQTHMEFRRQISPRSNGLMKRFPSNEKVRGRRQSNEVGRWDTNAVNTWSSRPVDRLRPNAYADGVWTTCRHAILVRSSANVSRSESAYDAASPMIFALLQAPTGEAGNDFTSFTFDLSAEPGETWLARSADLANSSRCAVSTTALPSRREVVLLGIGPQCNGAALWKDFALYPIQTSGEIPKVLTENYITTSIAYPAGALPQSAKKARSSIVVMEAGAARKSIPNQLWELAFEDGDFSRATWRHVRTEDTRLSSVPSARLFPTLHAAGSSLILYGGVNVSATSGDRGKLGYFLCDLWEFDMVGGEWVAYGELTPDCVARQNTACKIKPLSTYLVETDTLVVLVTVCNPPHHEVWLYSRAERQWTFASTESADLRDFSPVEYAQPESVALVSGFGDNSVFLVSAIPNNEMRIFRLVFLSNLVKNLTASLVDIAQEASTFPGRLGCRLPHPLLAPGVGQFFTLEDQLMALGGVCSPSAAESSQTQYQYQRNTDARLSVLSVGVDSRHYSKNALTLEDWPAYGYRIGQSVVTVRQHSAGQTGKVSRNVLFGGVVNTFTGGLTAPDDQYVPPHVWCFDAQKFTWRRQANFSPALSPLARAFHTAIAVENTFYIFGGVTSQGGRILVLQDLWQFVFDDISACRGKWIKLTSLVWPSLPAVYGHTATLLNNTMYVFGGATSANLQSGRTVNDISFALDLGTIRLKHLEINPSYGWQGRAFHSATAIGDRAILLSGGCQIANDITGQSCYNLREVMLLYPHDQESHQDTIPVTALQVRLNAVPTYSGIYAHQTIYDDHSSRVYILGGIVEMDEGALCPNCLLMFHPSCPIGHRLQLAVASKECEPCPIGHYSSEPGSTDCMPCPAHTTTIGVGAASMSECKVCKPGVCHHGECRLDTRTFQATCVCQPGYWAIDHCYIPVYYILGSVAALTIAIISSIAIRRTHQKIIEDKEKARLLRASRKEISQLASASKIDPTELSLRSRIDGKTPGFFGEVWLAEYRDMLVAMKRLKNQLDPENVREFEREVEVLRSVRHPNIVLFLGSGTETKTQNRFLVLEYLKRGPLQGILADESVHIDHGQRLHFALDAAKGMRYLHGLDPPRIHRDLKSSNLLVSEKWIVKVADFGMARLLGNAPSAEELRSFDVSISFENSGRSESTPLLLDSGYLSRQKGTAQWQSPEMLADRPYGPKTDVYSFGMVLWEIFARKLPYHGCADLQFYHKLARAVIAGRRPAVDASCPRGYAELMFDCWQGKAELRPPFSDIVSRLEELLESSAYESGHTSLIN